MADATDLKSVGETRVGSTPTLGTNRFKAPVRPDFELSAWHSNGHKMVTSLEKCT